MKKENFKQVFMIIIAIAIVSMIVGFVGYIAFFDHFANYSFRMTGVHISDAYNFALKPYFIAVLMCLIAIVFCFVVMFCVNLTKISKRKKKIINLILIGAIILLSIVSIVVSRLSVLISVDKGYSSPRYDTMAYAYYETAFGQALTTTIPALITAISIIFYMFSDIIFKNCESEKEDLLKNEA